jgi:outer membrane immunogenic protein
MFNRFSAISVVSALFAFQLSSAAGAEIDQAPLKSPRLVTYDWAGFYFGVHGGYGWGHDPFFTNTNLLPLSNITSHGAVYGVQGGYNWQYRTIVFGLETDFSATHIEGSTSNSFTAPPGFFFDNESSSASLQDRFHYIASLRARAGFAPFSGILVYATGGPAWAHTSQTFTFTSTDTSLAGQLLQHSTGNTQTVTDRFGLAAGAGLETRFTSFMLPLLARLEYLHYDFGNQSNFSNSITNCFIPPCVTTGQTNTSGRLTTDVVRAGVSIQFK